MPASCAKTAEAIAMLFGLGGRRKGCVREQRLRGQDQESSRPSASEVTTLWRYRPTNTLILILIITPGSRSPGLKTKKVKPGWDGYVSISSSAGKISRKRMELYR